MEPISRPVVPPQPDQSQFGIGELALLRSFSRESYRSVFGMQAPSYDSARRRKTWFDSSVDQSDPESLVVYKVVAQDRSGTWVLRQIGMPAREAATVNLPGDIDYPEYKVDSTRATRGGSPLNPDYLSLESQARDIASAVQADGIVDEGATTVFAAEYPSSEPRRMWAVTLRGRSFNAGILLKSRNALGAGTPGYWDGQSGEPVWISELPAVHQVPVNDTQPAWDMPCRDLLPNEKLQTGLFGPAVVRTDKQAEAELSSGKFLPADRALLRQILTLLQGRAA